MFNSLVNMVFLSTPSGWRATSSALPRRFPAVISIHALRVEGDHTGSRGHHWLRISIHALRVEGDLSFVVFCQHLRRFLSTPSGWRATAYAGRHWLPQVISIHALRVEGDCEYYAKWITVYKFLSTPSGWRATAKTDKVFVCFCAKGRRICLFKTRKEKNLPVAF